MKWFREWRAWVRAKEAEKEENLARRVREMVSAMKYPESPYTVYDIIAVVRRYDRRGVQ